MIREFGATLAQAYILVETKPIVSEYPVEDTREAGTAGTDFILFLIHVWKLNPA